MFDREGGVGGVVLWGGGQGGCVVMNFMLSTCVTVKDFVVGFCRICVCVVCMRSVMFFFEKKLCCLKFLLFFSGRGKWCFYIGRGGA